MLKLQLLCARQGVTVQAIPFILEYYVVLLLSVGYKRRLQCLIIDFMLKMSMFGYNTFNAMVLSACSGVYRDVDRLYWD